MNSDRPYIKALDSLRVIAISAVVLVHTTTRTIEAARDNLAGFPWTLFLNQIGRFSVPLFFIVSGFALELNYPKFDSLQHQTGSREMHSVLSLWDYYKRRMIRVLIPFIFWSLIYYFLIYTNNHDNLAWVLFTGNASYQLYFIPSLIIFYLIFPFLHKIYRIISDKWVFTLLVATEVLLLYKDYYIKEFNFADPIRIAILAYIFFIAGMIAAQNKEKIILFVKKWKTILLPLAVVSGIYIFLEGLTKFITTKNYLTFYSTWRPSVFVYSTSFALIFFYLFDKSHLQFSIIKKLSNLSFFVFFIHVIILETVWSLFGHNLFNFFSVGPAGRILFDPIFFAAVLFISFLTAFAAHKIPYLEKVTG